MKKINYTYFSLLITFALLFVAVDANAWRGNTRTNREIYGVSRGGNIFGVNGRTISQRGNWYGNRGRSFSRNYFGHSPRIGQSGNGNYAPAPASSKPVYGYWDYDLEQAQKAKRRR